jgi:hypothetical protein
MGPPLSKGHIEIFIESKLIGIWLSMLDIEYAPYINIYTPSIYQYMISFE